MMVGLSPFSSFVCQFSPRFLLSIPKRRACWTCRRGRSFLFVQGSFFFFCHHIYFQSSKALATPGVLPEHMHRGYITRFLSLRPPIPILVRY